MADIRILRTSGLTPPVGALLYPGQLAVTERRLFIGLYNSTDEAATPYGVPMLDFPNTFNDSIDIMKDGDAEAFKVQGTNMAFIVDTSNDKVDVYDIANSEVAFSINKNGEFTSDKTSVSKLGTSSKRFSEAHVKKLYLYDSISESLQAVTK